MLTEIQKIKALDTCKNPLKGARPVPGPIMMMGTEGSAGNLKLDVLIKTGALLQ